MTRFGLLITFIIAIGILTWDEIKNQQRVPVPTKYVHAAVVWGILGIIADFGAPEVASVFGLGLVLAMAYGYYNSQHTTTETNVGTMSGSRPLAGG